MNRPSPLERASRPVEERSGPVPTGAGWEELTSLQKPVLLRGAADEWELVQAGRRSAAEAADRLQAYHNGQPVTVYRGDAAMRGRFHYTDALDGFNFAAAREPLANALSDLLEGCDPLYIGSTDVEGFFPGFAQDNGLDLAAIHPMLVAQPGLASLWIGNRTTASAHYDFSHNIAVCAVGRRRFTLFAPDQIGNLYPGPLEPTPGGQVVSMVDIADPDFERFPRFAQALDNAQVAEMEPGDVLVYPAMWWHCVEALEDFNVLANYWWNAAPPYVDSPQVTLMHGLLSLRSRPREEREAWREIFDFYLFGDTDDAAAHLPAYAQGPLGPLDPDMARRLRAAIQRRLQR